MYRSERSPRWKMGQLAHTGAMVRDRNIQNTFKPSLRRRIAWSYQQETVVPLGRE